MQQFLRSCPLYGHAVLQSHWSWTCFRGHSSLVQRSFRQQMLWQWIQNRLRLSDSFSVRRRRDTKKTDKRARGPQTGPRTPKGMLPDARPSAVLLGLPYLQKCILKFRGELCDLKLERSDETMGNFGGGGKTSLPSKKALKIRGNFRENVRNFISNFVRSFV